MGHPQNHPKPWVLIPSCYRIISNAINHLQTVGIWLVSDINWISYVCSPQWWLITLLIHRVSSPHGASHEVSQLSWHRAKTNRTSITWGSSWGNKWICKHIHIYIYNKNIYIYKNPWAYGHRLIGVISQLMEVITMLIPITSHCTPK